MIKMVLIVKYQLELIIKGDYARSSSSLNDISLYLKQKKLGFTAGRCLILYALVRAYSPLNHHIGRISNATKICVNGIFKKQKYKKITASKYLVYYKKTV